MVVGVCNDEVDSHNPGGWGLSLTHGALFYKAQGQEQGKLSTKQLIPTDSIKLSRMERGRGEIRIEARNLRKLISTLAPL